MKLNSMSRIMLSVVLSISLIATGCSAQWISVALADLPVLTQMALNIGALVAALQTGKHLNPAEALAIQNISAEASKDLTLLQSLYTQYKANPNADTRQKINSLIEDLKDWRFQAEHPAVVASGEPGFLSRKRASSVRSSEELGL